jgi:aspartate oxidase
VQDWARYEVDTFVTDQNEVTARVNASNKDLSLNTGNKREDETRAAALLRQLKSVMWDNVGVVRSKSGLEMACGTLFDIQREAEELYCRQQHKLTTDVENIMIRDASYAGLAVATAAMQNTQSRGSHFLVEEACDVDDEQVAASI